MIRTYKQKELRDGGGGGITLFHSLGPATPNELFTFTVYIKTLEHPGEVGQKSVRSCYGNKQQ